MNIVVLKGNLTRDPESRKIQGGSRETTVTNFALAVNRHYKRGDGTKDKEVTYVDCEAWDTGGETIARFVKKGDPILIRGALKLDQWETDGVKRSKLKVRVNEFELLNRAPAGGYPDSGSSDAPTSDAEAKPDADADAGATGDGIPF